MSLTKEFLRKIPNVKRSTSWTFHRLNRQQNAQGTVAVFWPFRVFLLQIQFVG